MSLATSLETIFSRIPPALQAAVTFENAAAATTSSVAMADPSNPTPDEGFRDSQLSRKTTLTLWVRGSGLAFVPKAGMKATWGGFAWNVVESIALAPAGTALHYKVTVQR